MSSTSFESFEQVASQPAKMQRILLDHPDPPTRIWAAWAVSLALGLDAYPLIATRLENEAHPGVRRQLLVVLAGMGERDVIGRRAYDDSMRVRATAVRYLAVLESEAVRPILARAFEDPHALVRASAVLHVDVGSPLYSKVEDRLDRDPSRRVRLAAARRVHSRGRQHESLARAALSETDPRLLKTMLDLWLDLERPEQVLEAAAGAEKPLQEAVLTALDRRGVRVPWSNLEPLIDVDPRALIRLSSHFDRRPPLAWLIRTTGQLAGDLMGPPKGLEPFVDELAEQLQTWAQPRGDALVLDREAWLHLAGLRDVLATCLAWSRSDADRQRFEHIDATVLRLARPGWQTRRVDCRALLPKG